VAGFLVGPHTPGFVADREVADQLAEVGIILLMFGVGLQFHLEELLAVRRIVVPGALAACLAATLMGTAVGVSAGWGVKAGLAFGLAISVSSTVVLLRVLSDAGDLHTRAGHVAVGWLVVEDLLTIFVLVVLPAAFARAGAVGGGPAGYLLLAIVLAVVKVGALGILVLYGGGRLIPWVLARAAATRSRELFTLSVLVLALGIAVASGSPWPRPRRSASRWPWARSSPGWSWGARSSACGRRPRRCRCAMRSPSCSSSRSGCSSTIATWRGRRASWPARWP
jgi:CPA2 family monovalent cation:H+ antiporter-2